MISPGGNEHFKHVYKGNETATLEGDGILEPELNEFGELEDGSFVTFVAQSRV